MDVKASTMVHRLLFSALTEMRDQGRTTGDKLVYHLADLFHNASLQMEAASQDGGELTYDDVLNFLKSHAHKRGLDSWLNDRMAQIEARVHANSAAE